MAVDKPAPNTGTKEAAERALDFLLRLNDKRSCPVLRKGYPLAWRLVVVRQKSFARATDLAKRFRKKRFKGSFYRLLIGRNPEQHAKGGIYVNHFL